MDNQRMRMVKSHFQMYAIVPDEELIELYETGMEDYAKWYRSICELLGTKSFNLDYERGVFMFAGLDLCPGAGWRSDHKGRWIPDKKSPEGYRLHQKLKRIGVFKCQSEQWLRRMGLWYENQFVQGGEQYVGRSQITVNDDGTEFLLMLPAGVELQAAGAKFLGTNGTYVDAQSFAKCYFATHMYIFK